MFDDISAVDWYKRPSRTYGEYHNYCCCLSQLLWCVNVGLPELTLDGISGQLPAPP